MRITDLQLPTLSTSSLVLLVILFGGLVRAQQQEGSVTPVPRIQPAHHIFNAQQERALGNVEAEWLEATYQVVHDDGLAPISTLSPVTLSRDSRQARRRFA